MKYDMIIAVAFISPISVVATVYETFEALPATKFDFVIVGGELLEA